MDQNTKKVINKFRKHFYNKTHRSIGEKLKSYIFTFYLMPLCIWCLGCFEID